MDKELTKKVLTEKGVPIKVQFIKESDHQLLFQNCEALREEILNACKIAEKTFE